MPPYFYTIESGKYKSRFVKRKDDFDESAMVSGAYGKNPSNDDRTAWLD